MYIALLKECLSSKAALMLYLMKAKNTMDKDSKRGLGEWITINSQLYNKKAANLLLVKRRDNV